LAASEAHPNKRIDQELTPQRRYLGQSLLAAMRASQVVSAKLTS